MHNGHGDDIHHAKGVMLKANFSTNVWYEAKKEIIREVITRHIDNIFHYPEPSADTLREEIAAYHGIHIEHVIAGNGSTELFYAIAHHFAGMETVIPVPSFAEYEDACRLFKHRISFVPLDEADTTRGDLMFICNPNNPNGHIWPREQIIALLEKSPKRTLVVDESFIDFAPDAQSCIPLLLNYPNLLVVHSMTKNYAIPGLRLGYLAGGNTSLVQSIHECQYPWSVNALSIEVGKFLLREGRPLLPDVSRLLERKDRFTAAIASINGYTPLPSGTSFFLIKTIHDSRVLKDYLLEKRGLLIRDASNFRGLDEHYFRVNTLTEEQNNLLTEALESFNRLKY